jgi:hypothetical protein
VTDLWIQNLFFSGVKEKYENCGFDGGVRPCCEQSYDIVYNRAVAQAIIHTCLTAEATKGIVLHFAWDLYWTVEEGQVSLRVGLLRPSTVSYSNIVPQSQKIKAVL